MLRGGGVIFVLAVWVWCAFASAGWLGGSGGHYWLFLAAVTIAAGISFVDDVHSLPDSVRMVNDEALQEFVVTFARAAKGEVNGEDNGGDGEDNAQIINNMESSVQSGGAEDNVGVDVRVERIPYKDLPQQWKDVIKYCSIPRSAREIIAHLNYSYNSKYISEILHPLMDMGYLEMLFPDKPNSKNQKYRKVERK